MEPSPPHSSLHMRHGGGLAAGHRHRPLFTIRNGLAVE
jgi:hypothetical protein